MSDLDNFEIARFENAGFDIARFQNCRISNLLGLKLPDLEIAGFELQMTANVFLRKTTKHDKNIDKNWV